MSLRAAHVAGDSLAEDEKLRGVDQRAKRGYSPHQHEIHFGEGMPMRAVLVAVCLLLSAASASAEMTVKDFLARFDRATAADKELLQTLLGQVDIGLGWANSRLGFLKRPKLYCEAGNVALTDAQVLAVLRRQSQRKPVILQAPYGLGLLMALEEEYHCP
jgi:hypothetical protein